MEIILARVEYTVNADMLNNPILSTMMYSVYSAYRDAGAMGEEKKAESINQLSICSL
jgi:hypothetical protein